MSHIARRSSHHEQGLLLRGVNEERVGSAVGLDDELRELLVAQSVGDVSDDAEDVEAGEDGVGEVDVVGEGAGGVWGGERMGLGPHHCSSYRPWCNHRTPPHPASPPHTVPLTLLSPPHHLSRPTTSTPPPLTTRHRTAPAVKTPPHHHSPYRPPSGFAAAMTEHRACSCVTMPALEMEMLCCSMAS